MVSANNFLNRAVCWITTTLLIAFCMYQPALHAQEDNVPPIIDHVQETGTVAAGTPYSLTARVTDNDQVNINEVNLFYRTISETDFLERSMIPSERDNEFVYRFDPAEIKEPGIDYYISAEDVAGNTQTNGFSFDPNRINVGPPDPMAGNIENTDLAVNEKPKTYLYVLGAILAAGVVASLSGGDEDPQTTTFQVE